MLTSTSLADIGRVRAANVEGMRSIEYSVTGGPEVLTLVDRPVPDPGPGEVRVRIHRSGVNPTDWKSRRGNEAGVAVDPPQVPNQDGSGVVDAVGQGVEAALLGLRVWIWEAAHLRPTGGTAQEYAVVPARHVVFLPDVASFDLGASLGVPFLTAHRCLTVNEDGPRASDRAPWRVAPSWWREAQGRSATPPSSSPGGPTPRSSPR